MTRILKKKDDGWNNYNFAAMKEKDERRKQGGNENTYEKYK